MYVTCVQVMKAMPKEEISRKRKADEKLKAAKKAKVQPRDIVRLTVINFAHLMLVLFTKNVSFYRKNLKLFIT